MSFQEIPLNGDEQAYLNRSNNKLFSAIAAYGSVTQEVYDSLTPPEQQAIMDALSTEKQVQLRQYQLDIQKAHETTNVARDVQTGVADVARSTVIVPAAPITDVEINKVQEDTKKAEEVVPPEEVSAVGTEPIAESDLPETPNTAIAVLRLMTLGYFPIEPTKKGLFMVGDPLKYNVAWVLRKPAEWNNTRTKENQADVDRVFAVQKRAFENAIVQATKGIMTDMEAKIANISQHKGVSADLDHLKSILNNPSYSTSADLQRQFLGGVKGILRVTGLAETKVFKKNDAKTLKQNTETALNDATTERDNHKTGAVTERANKAIAEGDKIRTDTDIARTSTEITRLQGVQTQALNDYNNLLRGDPKMVPFVQNNPNAFQDLDAVKVNNITSITNNTTSIATIEASLGTTTPPPAGTINSELNGINGRIASLGSAPVYSTDTNYHNIENKLNQVNGHPTTPLYSNDATYDALDRRLADLQSEKRNYQTLIADPATDKQVRKTLPGLLLMTESNITQTMSNLGVERSRIDKYYRDEATRLTGELAARKSQLDTAHASELTQLNSEKSSLETERTAKTQQVANLNTENSRINDVNTDIDTFKAAHPNYTALLTALSGATTHLGIEKHNLTTLQADLTRHQATVQTHQDAADTAEKKVTASEGERARLEGNHAAAKLASDRLNQGWTKTIIDAVRGKAGISKAEANTILSSVLGDTNNNAPPVVKNAIQDLYDPHKTLAEKQHALAVLEAECVTRTNIYSTAKKEMDRIVQESAAKRAEIVTKMQAVDAGNLTTQQVEAKKQEILKDVTNYNKYIEDQNRLLGQYGTQINKIDPKLLKHLSGLSNSTSFGTPEWTQTKTAIGAKNAFNGTANRAGQVMFLAGGFELAQMWVQTTSLKAGTAEEKAEKSERIRQTALYTGDAAIGVAGMIPGLSIGAGLYDLSIAAKMAYFGTDVAGNKVTLGDAAIRGGLGVIGMIPIAGNIVRAGAIARGSANAAKAAEVISTGATVVGKGAMIGFTGVYASEKLQFGLVDVGSWNKDAFTPKTPPAKPAN